MSLFTVDSENVFGNSIAEAGTYNVKIVAAQVNVSEKAGNEYVAIDLEVVDGKYKGGQIRYQNVVWDKTKPEVSEKRFNTIAVAIGAKDGVEIDSVEQFAKAILNKQLSVATSWNDPNNKGQIYLGVDTWHKFNPDGSEPNGVMKPTNKTAKQGTNEAPSHDPFTGNGDPIDIQDDDLPF